MLSIGEVARLVGVSVETVRFYEREGLLAEPDRKSSGYRQYEVEAVERLRFIKQSKELGFTLKEIKELLALRHAPGCPCEEVRDKAVAKIEDIRSKIRALRSLERALVRLAKACDEAGGVECPMLDALEGRETP